jgi:predicted MPP superfamily phosphohydrolase
VNWGFLLLRIAIASGIFTVLFLSQRFWYVTIWRVTANWGSTALRVAARLLYVGALLLVILATADGFRMGHRHMIPRGGLITMLAGLWFSSALFAYLAVKSVRGIERLWRWLHRSRQARARAASGTSSLHSAAPYAHVELLADPSRRHFFRTASIAAGAAPFLGVMYGFAAERLNYQVRRVEIPVPNLPDALDGMKITQLSDIHLSGYMPRSQVRRAVDMANDLGADLAVVTGDLITGAGDPIAECIDEVRRLHAPLCVWGCNGNHEIYARAEDTAEILFEQAGMKLLRGENAQITFRGAQFNLIGVDYQRERTPSGRRLQMLADAGPLVRRDMPNILLSHNPNSFNRAAELGVELSLAGHTHGGQIQVEILDHRLSPARFITDYVAGTYQRPLFAPALSDRESRGSLKRIDLRSSNLDAAPAHAVLYVNRGLGTVGAPVRLGVPPEITLLILRRA